MEVKLATATSVFGAALTSMLVAPELQADVVSLTFNPATNFYSAASGLSTITMPEVGGASFWQWNASWGKSLFAQSGIDSFGNREVSQTISPGTFSGVGLIIETGSASGTNYVAFRSGLNVGWFAWSSAGLGADINYVGGAYGNAGEDVHINAIPSPGALALLALGAVGVRRKRKRAA